MNECGACGLDFTSVRAFDAHRVGKHAYTYSEGAAMDPIREDGRRCLSVSELEASPLFALDAKGRWFLAMDARRLRAHHAARESAAVDG